MKLLYISHGGGPMPLLGDPGHQALVDYLSGLPEKIGKPSAILVVSAHWEEAVPAIT
ncbi:MAG TPA: dioxygenase, partial [Marinobacter sp.]|nr:dioxygenase [Marinobacter sp.]